MGTSPKEQEAKGRMKIVVTGGSGFIGAATVEELRNQGNEVETFDRADGKDILTDEIPKCDWVVHLAGVLGTAELFDEVQTAIDVNVTGTRRVLDAAVKHGAGYTGICMPDVFPSVYTATKVAGMRLASAYHNAHGLPVSHVRAFNAFGPGQKHGAGHPRKIIPAFATEGWNNEPITIWGDGEQTVDLIYTPDLAKVLADAVGFGDDLIFDGGSGRPHTVNEVAKFVTFITGSTAGVKYLPMRRGERATDIKAEGEGWDLLDWKPTFNREDLISTVHTYK